MKKLKETLNAFHKILESNLVSDEKNHYEIINCLGNVFYEANECLKSCKLLEEKAPIFDLMKTLHPYLLNKKEDIVKNLKLEDEKDTVELKLAFAVFNKETTNYSKFLRKANKEKINRNKKKYKKHKHL